MAYFLPDNQILIYDNMKTSISKMGGILLGMVLFLTSHAGFSQDKKLTKEEQKAIKNEKNLFNFQVIDSMLQSRSFVIEADYLENQYGERRPVQSNLNFIMVDSSNVVLQTGSDRIYGSNGVGGATAEGNVRDLNIVKNTKNHSFFLRFTVVTTLGIYDVDMTIYSNQLARATITGLTRGKLVYDGRIKNLYDSQVYRGRNSI
jgi:hypothetical protein